MSDRIITIEGAPLPGARHREAETETMAMKPGTCRYVRGDLYVCKDRSGRVRFRSKGRAHAARKRRAAGRRR